MNVTGDSIIVVMLDEDEANTQELRLRLATKRIVRVRTHPLQIGEQSRGDISRYEGSLMAWLGLVVSMAAKETARTNDGCRCIAHIAAALMLAHEVPATNVIPSVK